MSNCIIVLHLFACRMYTCPFCIFGCDTIATLAECVRQGTSCVTLEKGSHSTSLSLTSFRFSNTLTLLCLRTHPGLTSGCATYTLNLQCVEMSWGRLAQAGEVPDSAH